MGAILETPINNPKIFIWGNRFQKVQYTNSTGSAVSLKRGRVLGRITSSQKALPTVAAATDGSQQPVFICADDYDNIANGATVSITVCDGGDVDEGLLLFSGSETLNTVITDDVSIRSALVRNSNIKLVKVEEMTR